ncbi:MAG: DNA repair protein RadC [Thermodesulfobacteriota bacterium]
MEKTDWQQKGAGHRQRLRGKFLSRGIDAFTEAEVVELLLTLGTPRKDCKEMARALIGRFGSLSKVLEASQAELEQVHGIGPTNSFALHFVHGVARRYLKERLIGKEYLRSTREVAEYLIHAMRGLGRETFVAIFLDNSFGILASETISEGSIASAMVYPRELIRRAFEHHAAALVVAHNHPSGNLVPSASDRELTRRLFVALALVDVQLLDHVIAGGNGETYSFADHGLMAEIRQECQQLLGGR